MKIEYDELNQIENGNEESVISGRSPLITYTFYIYLNDSEDFVFSISANSIELGYQECVEWISNNCEIKQIDKSKKVKRHYKEFSKIGE